MDLNRRTLFETMAGFLAASQVLEAAEVKSVLLDSRQGRLEQHPFGNLRVYFEGSTAGLKSLVVGSLVLNPGQEPHPPHTHLDEEIMVITEGSGQIIMNGHTSSVGPGGVMYAAPNYLHGVRNTGSTPLTFYYMKWVGKTS